MAMNRQSLVFHTEEHIKIKPYVIVLWKKQTLGAAINLRGNTAEITSRKNMKIVFKVKGQGQIFPKSYHF